MADGPTLRRVETVRMAKRFTAKQGQYLAFICNYSVILGRAHSEANMQRFFGTSPPTIHQMVLKLAELHLIRRKVGEARSIESVIDPDEIPRLHHPLAPDVDVERTRLSPSRRFRVLLMGLAAGKQTGCH